jgi:hypothetical protein
MSGFHAYPQGKPAVAAVFAVRCGCILNEQRFVYHPQLRSVNPPEVSAFAGTSAPAVAPVGAISLVT